MEYVSCKGGFFQRTDDLSGYSSACYRIMPDGSMNPSAIEVKKHTDKDRIRGLPVFFFRNPFSLSDRLFRPNLIIPVETSTVWDWAYFFNMYESWLGDNEGQRSILNALACKDFFEVSDSVGISEWDGLHWRDVQAFGYRNQDDAARNALYCAASFGVISVPFDVDSTLRESMSKSGLVIDNKGDIF